MFEARCVRPRGRASEVAGPHVAWRRPDSPCGDALTRPRVERELAWLTIKADAVFGTVTVDVPIDLHHLPRRCGGGASPRLQLPARRPTTLPD
eukprot:4111976-Prymnesium_polylepis.1